LVSVLETSRPGDEEAGGHDPLTTKEGWRQFVNQPHNPPDLCDPAVVGSIDTGSPHAAAVIEDMRLAHHSRLAVVATPTVSQVTLSGRRLVVLNRAQLSARRGLVVSGPAGTGKTTAITQLGKAHELATRLRHPQSGPRMPVIYVTVPPAATAKMLAVEFARFLGLPASPRANITDITDAVCAVLTDLRCDMVIVDELHNLNMSTRAGGGLGPAEVLLRTSAGNVHLRPDRSGAARLVHRHQGPSDRVPVHHHRYHAVRLLDHHAT